MYLYFVSKREQISTISLLSSILLTLSVIGILLTFSPTSKAQATLEEMDWAYAISPAFPAEEDDGTLHSLPGSEGRFTLTQARNRFGPADWYPQDHLPMPSIVEIGRESAGIMACSLCHYPSGQGKPVLSPWSQNTLSSKCRICEMAYAVVPTQPKRIPSI